MSCCIEYTPKHLLCQHIFILISYLLLLHISNYRLLFPDESGAATASFTQTQYAKSKQSCNLAENTHFFTMRPRQNDNLGFVRKKWSDSIYFFPMRPNFCNLSTTCYKKWAYVKKCIYTAQKYLNFTEIWIFCGRIGKKFASPPTI